MQRKRHWAFSRPTRRERFQRESSAERAVPEKSAELKKREKYEKETQQNNGPAHPEMCVFSWCR